jgi:flavin-dependent dehydrogenase
MDYFEKLEGDINQQFKTLVEGNKYLRERFQDQELVFEPRKLEAWSIKTKKFHGNGFVLAGNATEFLDPVFSSGVMFAAVSGHLAANLVVKKLQGAEVDWETEYTDVMQQGVDTFRSYVNGWYDGTLEKIFFHNQPNEEIKKKICSVLAGYVWDMNNPFVQNHSISLRNVSKFIDFQIKMAELSR